MLDISKISHTAVYGDLYFKERLGHFTGSLSSNLIGEQSHLGKFTKTAITYIEGVAGEIETGEPMAKEFFNEDTNYGNAMEPEAINYFCEQKQLNVLRNEEGDSHKLIIQDEFSAVTPDGLVTPYSEDKIFDETGTKIKVSTLEVKCPPVHHRYIKLVKCTLPSHLKIVEPKYYWQVITQIAYCGCLTGYFACYNPKFKKKMQIIEFKAMDLKDDIKKLNLTLHFAKIELQNTLKLLQ